MPAREVKGWTIVPVETDRTISDAICQAEDDWAQGRLAGSIGPSEAVWTAALEAAPDAFLAMSCDAQHELAERLAANIGYRLVPETSDGEGVDEGDWKRDVARALELMTQSIKLGFAGEVIPAESPLAELLAIVERIK